jgi:hypothetical protein
VFEPLVEEEAGESVDELDEDDDAVQLVNVLFDTL